MDSNHTTGALFGAVVATYKSVIAMITALGFISIELILETALLALIGGALGWCGAEIMKWLKPFIKNLYLKIRK